jgi:hypothetical protein
MGNEVSSGVGRTAVELCAFWPLCGLSGIACELPVDFWWPVSTCLRMVVLEAQGDAV